MCLSSMNIEGWPNLTDFMCHTLFKFYMAHSLQSVALCTHRVKFRIPLEVCIHASIAQLFIVLH